MKSILTIILSFLLVVSGLAQTRNVVVNTNGAVVQPTNFWSADVTNARSGLGLGSAATNPASAFQPSSAVLSNLASSNGVNLTNIPVASVIGGLATNGDGSGLTNVSATNIVGSSFSLTSTVLSNLSLSNGGDLTNIRATNIVGASFSLTSSTLSNLSLNNGGSLTNIQASNLIGTISATNIVGISFSNAVQGFVSDVANATNTVTNSRNVTVYSISPTVNLITNTVQLPTSNAIAGDLARIIHTGPTNSVTRIRKIGEVTNLITLNQASESVDFIYNGTNWLVLPNSAQTTPIYFSGTNVSNNIFTTRANLGLSLSALTNTSVTNFKTALDLGSFRSPDGYAALYWGDVEILNAEDGVNVFYPIYWSGTNGSANAATTRNNLGLGWSALTNSNAGTRLVSVDSNGSVVSPTNFWQAAPIASNLQTIVQTFSPTTNSTNAATNGRNVYVYSLSTNISGITNTVTLPTNAATINGDNITVIHQGLTNTTTEIRKLGQTNNLITINKFDEAVKFIHENGDWAFYHNISFVEPIYFSGTNASANAAASRTNLGLGTTNNVIFNNVQFTSASITDGGFSINTNNATFGTVELRINNTNGIVFWGVNSNVARNATRINLGLGGTNEVTFGRLYISNTNVGAFEGLANLINSNNTTISNETLFRVGLAEATNRSAQFGFRVARTNNGGEGFATFSVFGYNALMMIGPSDRSRTNTNAGAGIEADIYSISETNKVATLIDTNTGAFTLHRPIGFRTNETNASPASGANFSDRARWLQIHVGTNTFYIPLFQ